MNFREIVDCCFRICAYLTDHRSSPAPTRHRLGRPSRPSCSTVENNETRHCENTASSRPVVRTLALDGERSPPTSVRSHLQSSDFCGPAMLPGNGRRGACSSISKNRYARRLCRSSANQRSRFTKQACKRTSYPETVPGLDFQDAKLASSHVLSTSS